MSDDFHAPASASSKGRYRVDGPIAAGGMGEVFRGWDREAGRPVALKRIKTGSHHRQARERFEREVRVLRRLGQSPGVVEIFDVLVVGDQAWVVMELVQGRTLRRLIDDEAPLELSFGAALGAEIGAGLSAVHGAGIVHRDLKASNVMVSDTGHAKLLDFGLARALYQTASLPTLTQHGKLLGSAAAMSPEQAEGKRVDARSDLFSFGSLLYEMLSGVSPFTGRHLVDTINRVCNHQPAPLRELRPEIPAALEILVEQLLEKDPDGRPVSAEAVTRRLEGFMV